MNLEELLEQKKQIEEQIRKIRGRDIAIGYCHMLECVDNETLVRKIHQASRDFETIATITDAIDAIEDCYNKRLRDSHVYIETEYYKFLDSRNAGLSTMLKMKREKEE